MISRMLRWLFVEAVEIVEAFLDGWLDGPTGVRRHV